MGIHKIYAVVANAGRRRGGRKGKTQEGGEGGTKSQSPPPPVSHQCQAKTDRHTRQPGLYTIQMPADNSLKLI
jgi:hypothetical protein